MCTKCHTEKPLDDFHKNKNTKDGRFPWCKTCVSENGKSRTFPISVEEKQCSSCLKVKIAEEFHRASRSKDGLSTWCAECHKEHYEENKDSVLEKQAEYTKKNPEVGKRAKKRYYEKNREKVIARSAAYYAEHSEEISAANKSNPEIPVKRRKRRLANLEEALKKEKVQRDKRRSEKRDHINRVSNDWVKKRKAEDINFRISTSLRSRLTKAIRRHQKSGSAVRDLGCSIPELRTHLESKFQQGMTWDNWGHGRGKWNIDHIVPLRAFDLSDRQHVVLACNYMNLQPLWHEHNMSKGSKIIPPEKMLEEFPLLWSDPSARDEGTSPLAA